MQPRDAGIPDPASSPSPVPPRRPSAATGAAVVGRIGGAPILPGRAGQHRPPGLAGSPDFGLLLKALRRRWLLALGLGLTLAAVVGAASWFLLAPKYTAFAQVRVSAVPDTLLPAPPGGGDTRIEFPMFLKDQANRLKSRFVLNAALNSDEVRALGLERKHADPVFWLEEELKVESQPDSEWVKISLMCADPDDALVIIGAVVKAYMQEVVQKGRDELGELFSKYDGLYNQKNNELSQDKQKLQELTEKMNNFDSEEFKISHKLLLDSLGQTQLQLGQVDFALRQAKGQLAVLDAEAKAKPPEVPDADIEDALEADPDLKALRADIQRYDTAVKGMRKGLVLPNARYSRACDRLDDLRTEYQELREKRKAETVARARRRAVGNVEPRQLALKSEIKELTERQAGLKGEVARLTPQVKLVAPRSAEWNKLKDEVARKGRVVDDLGQKREQIRYEQLARPRVAVVQEAALMARDIKKTLFGTILGTLAALFGTAFGVAWWEFRRRRVQSPDEVASGLGIRVVGAVPASADVEQLLNAPTEEQLAGHVVLESVDAIRTQLMRDANAENTRVLMVTSAGPGEGKTTLASHLASSLARAGRKTLLIDGDLRQPAVHQLFEAQLEPGLSEVLLGEVELAGALRPTTAAQGLSLLPAGQWDREVIQALARADVQQLFERLRAEFDFIILDAHPVLPAADALLLGQHADAVLLSLMRDVSRLPQVHAAAQRLANLGIRILGAVVNGVPGDAYAGEAQALAYSSR